MLQALSRVPEIKDKNKTTTRASGLLTGKSQGPSVLRRKLGPNPLTQGIYDLGEMRAVEIQGSQVYVLVIWAKEI